MPVRLRTIAAFALTLALAWACPFPGALAQTTTAADKALAEALFDRGLQLMRDGKYGEACPQLEQSQGIERGIGTLLYLAECYEKLGRTASAWAMFREAASAARAEGQPERAKLGSSRAERLEPTLSKLTINVAGAARTRGLLVLRNGQPVPSGVWGLSIPVDPGEQRVEARAPGRVPWSTTLQLPPAAASVHVDVPELASQPTPSSPPLSVASAPAPASRLAPPPTRPTAPAAATETSRPSRWQKPLGLAVGAVGVAGLVMGAYFGVRAIDKNSDADAACPNQRCATPSARQLDEQAHAAARLANGLVLGGAALLVGGAVLFFTAPSAESVRVGLGSTGTGPALQLGGRL